MAATTIVYDQSGTSTWVCPPGVTSIKIEAVGGGGTPGSRTTTGEEGGAGGGEYAAEPTAAVTPGKIYTINIPAAAAAATAGGNVAVTLDSVTVTAHGGSAPAANTATGAAGGTGSTNTTHYNGGAGATGTGSGGGGGGGSGGSAAVGNVGAVPTGATAVTGGGPGGNGASSGNTNGSSPTIGPGGGGGGGWRSSTGTLTGGIGGVGQVSLTYTYNPGIPAGLSVGDYESTLESMTAPNLAAAMTQMVSVGATYIRLDSPWISGTSVLGPADTVASAAVTAGMIPIMILEDWSGNSNGAGYWATGSGSFAAWCTNAATHYLAMGIHVYEIGNEVNLVQHWESGTVSAATYATCIQSCYANIKAVDPSAIVLFSGMSPYGIPVGVTSSTAGMNMLDFLATCYANGAQGSFDAFNIHPYNFSAYGDGVTDGGSPNEASTYNSFYLMDQTYELMLSNGDGAKKIWGTEFGIPTGTDAGFTAFTQNQQALALSEAYQIWASKSYTGPFLFFAWYDMTSDGDFGLYTSTGVAKLVLPIFEAGAAGTRVVPSAPPYGPTIYDNWATVDPATSITISSNFHAVSAANSLIAVVQNSTGVLGTATSTGDVWTRVAASSDTAMQWFLCTNPTAGTKSVTVNFSGGTANGISIVLLETIGKYNSATSAFNLTPSASGNWSTGSVTPASSNNLLVAIAAGSGAGPDQSGTPWPFISISEVAYGSQIPVAVYQATSTAAIACTWTNGTSDNYEAGVAAFTPGSSALVQSASGTGSSTTTIAATLTSNVTAGNGLILTSGLSNSAVHINTISGGGVTWTKAWGEADTGGDTEIWYGLNSSGGVKTITVTYSAATAGSGTDGIAVAEFYGLVQFDMAGGGTETLPTSISFSPARSGELVVTTFNGNTGFPTGNPSINSTAGSTYTMGGYNDVAWIISPVAGVQNATWTAGTAGNGGWVSATFSSVPLSISGSGINHIQDFTPSLINSGTTATSTLSAAATVGHWLIIETTSAGDTGGATTPSGGGVGTWLHATTIVDSTTARSSDIWYGQVTTSGQTVVTLTSGTGGSYPAGVGGEFSGINTSYPIASANYIDGSTAGTQLIAPSLTAISGQLYVGGGFHNGGVATPYTPSSGFTDFPEAVQYVGGTSTNAGAWQLITSAGTYQLTYTTAGSNTWAATGALFNPNSLSSLGSGNFLFFM
jgi:hypothetical protein